MSQPYMDVDEGLYQLYVGWCQAHQVTPSFKEYLQWKDEQGYQEDSPADFDWTGLENAR